jgi:ABC-type cobalamin/Fe3+-siderophores transport system ATPase subunit
VVGWRARLAWPDVLTTFNQLRPHRDWKRLFVEATTIDPREHLVRRLRPARKIAPVAAPEAWPRLVQFDVENFKSLERLSFKVPENARQGTSREEAGAAGALLILGENATGKSSLLEGAALCLADERTRDAARCDRDGLVLDPRFMDPTLKGGPERARLTATFADRSKQELVIANGSYQADTPPSGQPVFAYGAFRQYLKKSPKRLPVDHYITTLFASDRLLPNPTTWLLSLDQDRFNMVARSLHAIFAVEGDFEVIQREGNVCYVVTEYVDARGERRRERTPLDIVSSGFRAILAMTCDIMRGLMEGKQKRTFQSLVNARAIVLVDEIEAHLHPRWKLAIMASLREALPSVTFIVTSHDPLCLRGMASGEVMVLNRVRGEQAPGSDLPIFIESLSALPNIEELTIEQLLTADFFQLNSTSSLETDREYARIAELLKRREEAGTDDPARLRKKGFEDREIAALRSFTNDINEALPVGNSEVQRLVQEVVALYLQKRTKTTRAGLKQLRTTTRDRILKALRSI